MKSPLLLSLCLACSLAVSAANAATIRAYGTVLFIGRVDLGSPPPSLTALVAGDEFEVSFTYDDAALEDAPHSYHWTSAVTNFSLARTGGSGTWQPTGVWNSPTTAVFVDTLGNMQIFPTATGMPNWTGSAFAFSSASLVLQRQSPLPPDNDFSTAKSLGTRLGGRLSPNVSGSELVLRFSNGSGSEVSTGFRFQTFVPEPTTAAYLGLAAASCLRRRRLGKP